MHYTTWLKWGVIGGLCLSLFTLFIVADGTHFLGINMFFPYITGKNFSFRIIMEVVLALYVLLAIREPKYRPRSSLIMWAFGFFVLWMALATVLSVDPIKSFWSNFERMDGYITLLHMFALFVVAGTVLTAEKWWNKFFQISVAASYLMGIYALCQIFHIFGLSPSSQSGPRADTTFGNAIYLAVYMLFQIFITLFLLYRERKSKFAWWLYGIALVLQSVALYYTETRGALLGVLGGLVVAALYIAVLARGAQWKRFRKVAFGGVGVLVVLALGFLLIKNTSFVQNSPTMQRFANISLSDRTTQARFTIWGEAWKGIEERPVFGWGQENFNFVFNKFYNPTMYDQEQWFDRAHNAFLDWAVAGGIPAFVLYVSLFALAVWAVYKSELEVPEQAIFIGLLAAYAFNNLTVFDNLGSYLYFFLILAFIHGISRRKLSNWMFMSKPLGDKTMSIAAPVVLVVLVWGAWALNGPGMARAQTLIDALTPVTQTGAQKDPKDNLAAFQTALDDGPLGLQETVEQLFEFASNTVAPSTSISPDVKQQAFTMTQAAANALIKQRPNDARLELFYGIFFDQFGQYPQAITHLQNALADSPTKQQILFEIGETYIAEGDYKDALPSLQKAYTEDTSYRDAAVYYAAALYDNNDNAQADQLLTQSYGTTTVDNDQLMQAYYSTKQFGRLAAVYELRLANNPTDLQSMVGYAVATYFADGNAAKAVAELQKAAAANPSYATQLQSFIDQINKGTLHP